MTSSFAPSEQILIDDTNTTYQYIGFAPCGTVTSVALWKIKRITKDANGSATEVKFADGSAEYDNIWDNRVGLSYS